MGHASARGVFATGMVLLLACGGGAPANEPRLDATAPTDFSGARPRGGQDAGQGATDAGEKRGDAGNDGRGPGDASAVEASGGDTGATTRDAGATTGDAGNACSIDGEPGVCMATSTCASMAGYQSTPGHCPGPASIECCALIPNVADNPPVPAGWVLMQQSQVTPAMTTWAVTILNDPTTYPLFSTTIMTFGSLMVLARVEWHPPDFQNSVVHRGVTLYVPA